ncbi:MAG: hypothetical protein IJU20_03350 [Clostridia bacterium]|nr:hypothetical protein [Clostridia bacterium]
MRLGFTRREVKPVTEEQEKDFQKRMKDNKVGKKDMAAMLISAFIWIILPTLLVLLLIGVIAYAAFGGFSS